MITIISSPTQFWDWLNSAGWFSLGIHSWPRSACEWGWNHLKDLFTHTSKAWTGKTHKSWELGLEDRQPLLSYLISPCGCPRMVAWEWLAFPMVAQHSAAPLVAQTLNSLPAMQETWVQSLGQGFDPKWPDSRVPILNYHTRGTLKCEWIKKKLGGGAHHVECSI